MESFIGFFTCLFILLIIAPSAANAKKSDLKCLALNIFFEAQGESRAGQVGVGMVTINRARSGLFQSSICGVVYAYRQFSWVLDKYPNTPPKNSSWSNALKIAGSILGGKEKDPTNKASHFFNPKKINASWATDYTYVTTIGNHSFYRMRGFLKRLRAFKNGQDSLVDQEESYSTANLTNSSETQNILLEQQLRTDTGDHAERFEQFLEYIDSLPDERELTMEDYPTNQHIDPRLIGL